MALGPSSLSLSPESQELHTQRERKRGREALGIREWYTQQLSLVVVVGISGRVARIVHVPLQRPPTLRLVCVCVYATTQTIAGCADAAVLCVVVYYEESTRNNTQREGKCSKRFLKNVWEIPFYEIQFNRHVLKIYLQRDVCTTCVLMGTVKGTSMIS